MNIFASCLTLAMAGVAGCTGFSKDAGFGDVAGRAHDTAHADIAWPRNADEESKVKAQVDGLLEHPLSPESAVRVALLENRGLRGAFETLQISEADLVQAGRLPNPRFDLRHAGIAGQYDIEETLSFNVLALLTLPYVHGIETRRFAMTRHSVVLEVARLAAATRAAFYSALAAREAVRYRTKVNGAANLSAQLAARMAAAGNWNEVDAARERSFGVEASQNLTRAIQAETEARERMSRLMGVAPTFELAERLPDLPQTLEPLPDVETIVAENRLDLQLQRLELDALARRLNLTRATRFVNVLDAGPTRVLEGARDRPYERGYALSVEIPIFDSGAARLKKSEAVYARAADEYAQSALQARSEIRSSYAAYRAAYEIAVKQRDEILPLQRSVAAQNLLRYNASLISVFELLADAREQIAGVDACIQTTRDFWIAKSALDAALLGALKERS